MTKQLNIPKVKEILTEKVIAFRPEFTTFDVIKIFNEYRISSGPVINNSNEVVGYLSESDSIKCMENSLFFNENTCQTIESIMSKNVIHANPEWDIFELDRFFITNHIRSAPVVDSQNHFIGVVTKGDTLKNLERIITERNEYKKDIHEPLELSMLQKYKMLIDNH